MQHAINKLFSRLARAPDNESDLFVPDADRDIFLVTYPRSGTTWTSCIAGELMFNISPHDLTDIGSLVPDIHARPRRSAVPVASQYLVKSHFPFTPKTSFGAYRRVIYLMRDPRDVMLSYYRYEVGQNGRKGDLVSFARDWVNGRVWPGSWQEHITNWLKPRVQPAPFELDIFRYEDIVENPIEQATRLARLLGVSASKDRIAEVVADTKPAMMRQRESNGHAKAKPGWQFIGAAVAGGWRNQIKGNDLEAIKILEEHAGPAMRARGYALSYEAD